MKPEVEARATTLTGMLDAERDKRHHRQKTRLRPWVCSILAAVGIFGGISCLFVGLICVVLHGVLSQDVVFDQVGTVLLVAALPMILIGSIFVDKIEGNKR
jgi:hypothetical protein